jgi:hypothetical protein
MIANQDRKEHVNCVLYFLCVKIEEDKAKHKQKIVHFNFT